MSPDGILPLDDGAQPRDVTRRHGPQLADPEPALERLVRLAARALSATTATLTLLDRGGSRHVAVHGLPEDDRLGGVLVALASSALAGEGVFEATDAVLDANRDAEHADRQGVVVRFYAAAPLVPASGVPVGLLEVIDGAPRPPLDVAERQILIDLAAVAVDLLAARADRVELDTLRRELERRMDHDPLTGALTRRGLIDRLEGALSLVHRTEATLTVMLLERAGGRTPGREGQPALADRGDVEIVARLRAGVRDHDLVARWGEDTFAVVLQAADGVSEPSVARRLAQDLGRPLPVEDEASVATVSVGVATYPSAGEDALGLLGAAGAALVGAKLRGGGVAEARGSTDGSGGR